MSYSLNNIFQKAGGKSLLKGLAVIGLLVLIGYGMNSVDFEGIFKTLRFGNSTDDVWWSGPPGFYLACIGLIVLGAPRQMAAFFAAYFFGFWTGLVTAWCAMVTACVINFSIARLFRGYFEKFVKGKLGLAINFWRENTFLATIVWRFFPAGSNFFTNLTAGALGIPAVGFILGSAVGFIPQAAIFAILGTGVDVGSSAQIWVSIGLFIVSMGIGAFLYQRYRKRLKTEDQTSSV